MQVLEISKDEFVRFSNFSDHQKQPALASINWRSMIVMEKYMFRSLITYILKYTLSEGDMGSDGKLFWFSLLCATAVYMSCGTKLSILRLKNIFWFFYRAIIWTHPIYQSLESGTFECYGGILIKLERGVIYHRPFFHLGHEVRKVSHIFAFISPPSYSYYYSWQDISPPSGFKDIWIDI